MFEVVRAVAENGLAEDLLAVLVAAVAGFAVLLYAAASDLFDLKFFKIEPMAFRVPKQARVEYWYTRAAKKFSSTLTGGGWSYAKLKKRARVAFSREGRRLRAETRKLIPESVRRMNRDIALGVLAIAIVLVALLVLRLI